MKRLNQFDPSRRNFITSIMPVCAMACLGSGNNSIFAQTEDKNVNQTVHKFDQKLDRELTYLDYYALRYREFIRLTKALEKELGKEKLINFLKENTKKRTFELGQNQAIEMGDNSLSAYVKQFRPPNYQKSLTHEVVEDTETSFKIIVKECIWAKTFIDAGVGDIGYAHICYGDYSWTTGFNPKMRMERDKTLMQGHECCNHRYIIES